MGWQLIFNNHISKGAETVLPCSKGTKNIKPVLLVYSFTNQSHVCPKPSSHKTEKEI